MNKINVNIYNREFELNIVLQNYPGESVTQNQLDTIELISNTDFDNSLDSLKEYIRKNNNQLEDKEIANIFRYVMPKSILISREDERKLFYLLCNYKFDMEHGIALVFEDSDFINVCGQDEVL